MLKDFQVSTGFSFWFLKVKILMLDMTNMLKYHVHFLHVLDLPAADINRQYTNLQKGFIYLIYV